MVAYFNRTNLFESNDTIAIPMFASPSSIQGTWYARHMVYTAKGPEPRVADPISSQSGDGGSVANEFDQCVFIRYYTMRWRKRFPMFSKAIRVGAGPRDLDLGDNRGDTLPELAVQCGAKHTESGGGYFGQQWGSIMNNTAASEGEYDSWDVIAEYVFQVIPFFVPRPQATQPSQLKNSNAASVLMHHRDLAGIRAVGYPQIQYFEVLTSGQGESSGDISSLLAKKRPQIVVDESGGQSAE